MLVAGTFIGWLDHNQGAATALLSAVLVAVTVYYAVQTWSLVRETRRSREAAAIPKLTVGLEMIGPMHAEAVVTSVGPGAALDIKTTLSFLPSDPKAAPDARPWSWQVLVPNGRMTFLPPEIELDKLAQAFSAITLTGTMNDALGGKHRIDERMTDINGWWNDIKKVQPRWVNPDTEQRLARALSGEFKLELSKLASAAQGIEKAVSELRREDDPPGVAP